MSYFIAVAILLGLSARWNWWRKRSAGVPILMYHKVGIPPSNSKLKKLWVSPDKFRAQMKYLRKNGYESITFEDLAGSADTGYGKKVIITFDDGYRNNYMEAFSVLKEVGFKAVFYIVSDAVEKKNFWHDPDLEEPLEMLTWEDIKEMSVSGMEIGGHTVSHRNLARISVAEAETEIIENMKSIEKRTGKRPVSFSYPYGGFNKAVKEIVKNAGYIYAVIIKQGKNLLPFADHFALKRLLVRREESLFDFYLNLSRGRNRL